MIGVFDSGLGGLTAVKEIHRILPHEDVIYFGDTARVPYGPHSAETIIQYAKQDVRFLLTKNVDMILIACGTVSSTALDILKEENSLPIIGVVEATAKKATEVTRNGKVGIIGTSATIRSRSYEKVISGINPDIEMKALACPLFVPLVENGFTDGEIPRLTAEHYLAEIRDFGADTLILGCTHYPIIAPVIAQVLPGVTLVNSGEEAAKHIASLIGESGNDRIGTTHYFVSDSPEGFNQTAERFLQEPVRGNVTKINIEQY